MGLFEELLFNIKANMRGRKILFTRWYDVESYENIEKPQDSLIIDAFDYLKSKYVPTEGFNNEELFYTSFVKRGLKFSRFMNKDDTKYYFNIISSGNELDSKSIKKEEPKEKISLKFDLKEVKDSFKPSNDYMLDQSITKSLKKILDAVKKNSRKGISYVIISNYLNNYDEFLYNIGISNKIMLLIIKSELVKLGLEVDLNIASFDFSSGVVKFNMTISGWSEKPNINRISI